MIEAVMFWNEPNNKSHWDPELDPEWRLFAEMTKQAATAVQAENPSLLKVLGGISPIDPNFLRNMASRGALETLDVVAVHGFPCDWNHWNIEEWPAKLAEIRAVTHLPIWVSEVGVSTFGAEEIQKFGLTKTAELLTGCVPRIHWYSLYDLPKAWPATTRHREAEGSSYYRHFYMGLLREDGTPKAAYRLFGEYTPALGICQWFHFEDHRLTDAVQHLRQLGVRHVRTGLSWADYLRPNALAWFDRQMRALEAFEVTVTFCFTPEARGIAPHHTSPPRHLGEYAEFCAAMVKRYGAAGADAAKAPLAKTLDVRREVEALGPWFHNFDFGGIQTAPDHFLGDFPREKWQRFQHIIPRDLRGKTVLDIGCNGGFYAIEMKRRGADRVLAIDVDPQYLAQARFAAKCSGVDVEFQQCSVYEVGQLGEKFDLVLFMGVLYHLRYPLLALDLIREHVVKDLLLFQCLLRGSHEVRRLDEDYSFSETEIFAQPSFPRMFFIEHGYAGDPTNWWIPNLACAQAMLRSAGFEILAHPEQDVFLCAGGEVGRRGEVLRADERVMGVGDDDRVLAHTPR